MASTTKSTSLSVRLTPEEIEKLDATRAYQREHGRTVLGAPELSRADALRKLAEVGYKQVQLAIRKEKRRQSATADRDDNGSTDGDGPHIEGLAATLRERRFTATDAKTRAANRASDKDPTERQHTKLRDVTDLAPADLIRLAVAVGGLHDDCAGFADEPDPLAHLRLPEVSVLISIATMLAHAGEPGQ